MDIKTEYLALLDSLKENKTSLADPSQRELQRFIARRKELFEQVKETEADQPLLGALDSEVLRETSLLGLEQTAHIHLAGSLGPADLPRILLLAAPAPDAGLAWRQVGAAAAPLYRRSPGLSALALGPAPEKAPKAPRVRREGVREEGAGERVRPQELEEGAGAGALEAEAAARVRSIRKKLHKQAERVAQGDEVLRSFFAVTNDGRSFTRTVENLFYFAFLVKEGTAAVATDPASGIVSSIPDHTPGQDAPERHQCVLNFDVRKWRALHLLGGGEVGPSQASQGAAGKRRREEGEEEGREAKRRREE